MSIAIDAASRLHDEQVKAVARSQDLVVYAIEKAAFVAEGLRAKSPAVPGAVARPLEKAAAPLTKLVGDSSEVTSYLARSAREWVEVQHKFQAAVVDALVSDDQDAPVVKLSAEA